MLNEELLVLEQLADVHEKANKTVADDLRASQLIHFYPDISSSAQQSSAPVSGNNTQPQSAGQSTSGSVTALRDRNAFVTQHSRMLHKEQSQYKSASEKVASIKDSLPEGNKEMLRQQLSEARANLDAYAQKSTDEMNAIMMEPILLHDLIEFCEIYQRSLEQQAASLKAVIGRAKDEYERCRMEYELAREACAASNIETTVQTQPPALAKTPSNPPPNHSLNGESVNSAVAADSKQGAGAQDDQSRDSQGKERNSIGNRRSSADHSQRDSTKNSINDDHRDDASIKKEPSVGAEA